MTVNMQRNHTGDMAGYHILAHHHHHHHQPSHHPQVGDGTTTVVLLAGELLNQCKRLVEEGVHPHAIIRAFRRSTNLAIEKINEIAVKVRLGWRQGRRMSVGLCSDEILLIMK